MALKNVCLLLAILALLACGVFVAPRLEENSKETLAVSLVDENALESFRRDRERSRDTQLEQLALIITDEGVDGWIRDDAGDMRLELIKNMGIETTVEGVLTARGFGDVVCTVNRDSVNILLRTKDITKSELAIIMELATRETGQPAANIKIIPVSG